MTRRTRLAAACAAALLAGALLAGRALAEGWSKTTLHGLVRDGAGRLRQHGDATLLRLEATGFAEDGTINLAAIGASAELVFGVKGERYDVSYASLGLGEPVVEVGKAKKRGSGEDGDLPPDAARSLKDGEALARVAKAAGVGFPAGIRIHGRSGKGVAAIADAAGNSVALDATTGEKAR